MIVAVLGGGNGGYATAADLALAGHRVRWWRRSGAAAAAPVLAANLPVGVFPASRSEPVLGRLRELFPALRPCVDVLDTALTNAGPVIHPPLVLLNAGAIDAGRFDVHAAGTTASVR